MGTPPFLSTLRQRGRTSAGDLVRFLGISRPTLMRAVQAAGPDVLSIGQTRRRSYAARRPLRGSSAPLPLFRIDSTGHASEAGVLHLGYPVGSLVEGEVLGRWPLDDAMRDGWFEGIPYFLQDLRPEGYLGRAFAREHAPLLQVAEDPRDWNDDDALFALQLLGADQSGCYILGESAYRRWLEQRTSTLEAIQDDGLETTYIRLANESMNRGVAGSSAGGEFPKFTALRSIAGEHVHVLVKFSGSDDSPGSQRWADLLVCEHLALDTAQQLQDLTAAPTTIHMGGGRTFLEVQRFDRLGAFGRLPMCSWMALNNDMFGMPGRWPEAAALLQVRGLIDERSRDAIVRQWFYGQLIGNSDMHDGNLSFLPVDGQLEPSPMYDMLPMLWAPQRGTELPERTFRPHLPLPSEREFWSQAAQAALVFWHRASSDERVSPAFRGICGANALTLRRAIEAL